MDKKKNWFDSLNERLTDAFFDTFNNEDSTPRSVYTDIDFNDGSSIEIELHSDNRLEVFFFHADSKVERDCPNITNYLEDNLPDWLQLKEQYDDAIPEDEWTAHGFRNAADYYNYRLW